MLKSWRANFCPKRHYDWNLSQLVLPCSWWRQQKDLSHLSSMFWEPPEKFKQAGDWCRCQMKIMKLPVIIKFINFWRAQTSRLQMLQFLSFPKHNTIETCPNWSCLGGVGGVSRRILLQCFGNLRKSSSKEDTDATAKSRQTMKLPVIAKIV